MSGCVGRAFAKSIPLLLVLALGAGTARAEEVSPPPRAFGLGAQTEFRANVVGVPSLVFGWDGGTYQVEGAFGVDVTDDRTALVPNLYDIALRLFLTVHRGVNADFSLTAGGGLTVLDPPRQDVDFIGGFIVGARVRIFVAPNAAITGLAGAGMLFREQSTRFALGALPLGGAGFVYYFR